MEFIDKDLARSATLPSACYTDSEWYKKEQTGIFFNSWQLVGHTEQVAKPGDFFTFEIAGEPLMVLRDDGGELRCLSNVCRHRGALLLRGEGSTKTVRCPYHSWNYNLKGKLQGAPEFEGVENWEKEKVCLPNFRVAVWGPLVFVHLGKDPRSLADVMETIPDEVAKEKYPLNDYVFLHRKDYIVECNWKVYVDNYLEGYHIPTIHPKLFQELDYKQYRVDTSRYSSSQYAPLRPVTEQNQASRQYDPAASAQKPLYYWVFPNFMLNFYPDNFSSNIVLPLGPHRTLTIFEWFVPHEKKASLTSIDQTVAFSDLVQNEDIWICESVQKGLGSQFYESGRYSVKRENGVHHFHGLWQEFLGGSIHDR